MSMDKGYDYPRVRCELEQQGYTPQIRSRADELTAKRVDDLKLKRWVVERTNAWLKGFRAIRTRYCCRAQSYLALIKLACAAIVTRLSRLNT